MLYKINVQVMIKTIIGQEQTVGVRPSRHLDANPFQRAHSLPTKLYFKGNFRVQNFLMQIHTFGEKMIHHLIQKF